ncbi:MAG TPA: FG-GAP repeat protein, partial [Micromonosporaceae bacterium]
GDKYADLAIGSPYENTYGFLQDGMVTLVDGAASGLSLSHVTDVTGGQLNHTSVWPFNIGTSLVIADTNGDGLGEVIVAAPGTQRNTPPTDPIAGAGAVFVLHGAKAGISASGALTIGEDTPGVPGVAEEEDGFGFRIAAGDITGDGRADLLIGVPYEDIGSTADAGVVYLVPSSPSGLLPSKTTTVNQGSPGVPGSIATDDLFGLALGIHNLAGTSAMEALVGTPNDGGPNAASSGSITTFTSNGGTLAPGVRWTTADFAISDGTTFTNMPMPYGGVPGPGL